jgi:hypothetical protein
VASEGQMGNYKIILKYKHKQNTFSGALNCVGGAK